jgi:serine/threonine protein kinase
MSKLDDGSLKKGFYDIWMAAQNVFEGLCTMANKKIVHNDIKPENILFKKQTINENTKNRLNIIDWGDASFDEKNESRGFAGTLNYAPPEVDTRCVSQKFVSEMLKDINHRIIKFRKGHNLEPEVTGNDLFLTRAIEENETYCKKIKTKIKRTDDENKRDIYSWGVTLLHVFHEDMVKNQRFEKMLERITREDITQSDVVVYMWMIRVINVIIKMVRADPEQRLSASLALGMYKENKCISCFKKHKT